MKCSYSGCNDNAKFKLVQKIGKKQTTYCCEKCAPSWVKNNTKSIAEQTHGHSFYNVSLIIGGK